MEIAYCDKCGNKLTAGDLATADVETTLCGKCRTGVADEPVGAKGARNTPASGMRRLSTPAGGARRIHTPAGGTRTARKDGPATPRPGSVRREKAAPAKSSGGNSSTWLYAAIAGAVLIGVAYLAFSGHTPAPASSTQPREKKTDAVKKNEPVKSPAPATTGK